MREWLPYLALVPVVIAIFKGYRWLVSLDIEVRAIVDEKLPANETKGESKMKEAKEKMDEIKHEVKTTRQWLGRHVNDKDEHLGSKTYEEMLRRMDSQDRKLERIDEKFDELLKRK